MRQQQKRVVFRFIASLLVMAGAGLAQGATLGDVRGKDYLDCGVSTGIPGFSNPDSQGRWSGLDVDVCRAVAAAVLGDADKVRYTPLTPSDRFNALSSGEVDLLSRNTTWTHSRDTTMGMIFAGIAFYDGQGFMVTRSSGLTSASELNGAAVCIQSGTTSELNLADYFREHNMKYQPVAFTTSDQTLEGFQAGRCNVLSSDLSQLYAQRTRLKDRDSVRILPEVISKEPLGPAVRQGDMQWYNIVKWTLYAMVNAEEYGVNQSNVDDMRASDKPVIQRMLGVNGDTGRAMGLSADWAYQIIKQVGNYGEVFERNVGQDSELGFDRGLNELWSRGGILYAPPLR
ncbi:amino acid ABC transporter substrate-binding protein [Saccharospirillum salsuginis]|uniref:Amino acid ABC transporter substrate-binding protein n=1 Tax=Saccharospirillum salsuginis TaxID=418750 RepID=A0A918KS25_9GAMM|nr:amino acid ABC transporter substrate-binding protein [Saccharospirillum salsuginis]GGX71073.1 amino acid ABC transporter substrate-binding protein [Saccharospirillum salsuginis]